MRAMRHVGNALLWVVAALGVVSMLVWGATQLGYIKPLVVISGSMQPGIKTGDLLIDVSHPTADLKVGEVASLPSDITHNLVSHRVVAIEPAGAGRWSIHLKGDANRSEDGGVYLVGDHVWQPAWQIPRGGYAVMAITRRSIALPLGFALVCLLSLSLLPTTPRSQARGRHSALRVDAGAGTAP